MLHLCYQQNYNDGKQNNDKSSCAIDNGDFTILVKMKIAVEQQNKIYDKGKIMLR